MPPWSRDPGRMVKHSIVMFRSVGVMFARAGTAFGAAAENLMRLLFFGRSGFAEAMNHR